MQIRVIRGFSSCDMSDIQDINITMNTSKGAIKIRMFAADAQVTCASYLSLASRGFYKPLRSVLLFHQSIGLHHLQ